jgi:very-short-patch-repair endonuclease
MIYFRRMNESMQDHGASKNIKAKAKELRKDMTESERILWNYLRRSRQNWMYFRRQHPYGIYILDFYCFEANLAVEVDGKIHLDQKEYDLEKTKYLESSGLNVLRIENEDIDNRIDWVIELINTFLVK